MLGKLMLGKLPAATWVPIGASNPLPFRTWLAKVDQIVKERTGGFSYLDFKDKDFAGEHDAGTSPGEMAKIVIEDR